MAEYPVASPAHHWPNEHLGGVIELLYSASTITKHPISSMARSSAVQLSGSASSFSTHTPSPDPLPASSSPCFFISKRPASRHPEIGTNSNEALYYQLERTIPVSLAIVLSSYSSSFSSLFELILFHRRAGFAGQTTQDQEHLTPTERRRHSTRSRPV